MTRSMVILLAAIVGTNLGPQAKTERAETLIGTKAPEWSVTDWINSKPVALRDLRGEVVLVRWWTGGGCHYCAATAPSLNQLHEKYGRNGLVVIGLYHHKAAEPLSTATVRDCAKSFAFEFPVATDPGWQTLKKWWLIGQKRQWTSVSFLIDRQGVIRHIHPGGEYAPAARTTTT